MVLAVTFAAFAIDPIPFDPIPLDHRTDTGTLLEGILVDEATYAELGTLRVLAKTQAEEIESFEKWQEQQHLAVVHVLQKLKEEQTRGQKTLQEHYEKELERAKRRESIAKLAFPAGVGVGVVVTTALTLGVLRVYDAGLPAGLRRP